MSLALFQSKKQSKNSGIRGGLIPVSVTPLISEILNILSKSDELNGSLNQLAEIQLGENDCWKHSITGQVKSRFCEEVPAITGYGTQQPRGAFQSLGPTDSADLCSSGITWLMMRKAKKSCLNIPWLFHQEQKERELRGEPGMWEWHRAGTWESWDHPPVLPSQPSQFSPWFLISLNKVKTTKLPNSMFPTALERFFSSPLRKGFLCSHFFCTNSMLFMLEYLNSLNISPGLEEAPSVLNKRSQEATALNKV